VRISCCANEARGLFRSAMTRSNRKISFFVMFRFLSFYTARVKRRHSSAANLRLLNPQGRTSEDQHVRKVPIPEIPDATLRRRQKQRSYSGVQSDRTRNANANQPAPRTGREVAINHSLGQTSLLSRLGQRSGPWARHASEAPGVKNLG